MTVGTPAMWAGSATHPIRVPRNAGPTYLGLPMIAHANSATATTRGGGYGVVGGGDLAVTTTGALGYSIAAGRFALPGTFATAQGGYVDYNDAAVTGTLPARDATNPYIAYICARVRDTDEDATGAEITDFTVIQGTPAGSPAAPSVPSSLGSLLIMSQVLVPSVANGGAVVFTERRMYLAAIGGLIRCTSATNPSGAAAWFGQPIIESDTGNVAIHNGASFQPFGNIGAWRAGSVSSLTQPSAIGGSTSEARYTQFGKTVIGRVQITVGGSGAAGNDITVTIAAGWPPPRSSGQLVGTFMYQDVGLAFYTGAIHMTTGLAVLMKTGNTAGSLGSVPSITVSPGDTIDMLFYYESA